MTVSDRELGGSDLAIEQAPDADIVDDLPVPDEADDRYPEYGGPTDDDFTDDDPAHDEPDDGLIDDDVVYVQPGGLSRRHVVGSVLLARLASAGLWLLVVAAVLMAALALLVRAGETEPEVDVTASDARTDDAMVASGFAQVAVRRYIGEAGEDTEDVVASLTAATPPDLRGVTPAGFYVVDANTVDLKEREEGYWAATVAVDLMAAVDGRYEPIGMRYYSVGVITGDGADGPVLADLPSQVAAPAPVQRPELLADLFSTPDDSAQVAAIHEFLSALLLGNGSIERYTAPGVEIPAITPPPFTSLEIDEVAIADPDADQTVVRVSVVAVDDRGLAQRLNYAVGLQLRSDRWEVAELFDAPPLTGEAIAPSGDVTAP